MSTPQAEFGFGAQIRKSPFFDATVRWGARDFSVYNHMYIPRDFGDPEQNFWNLVNEAILCDVAVERQVEITGPDAARFVQMLTPRDLSQCAVGQCKYVLITNADGGILNDPVTWQLSRLKRGKRQKILPRPIALNLWEMLRYRPKTVLSVKYFLVPRSADNSKWNGMIRKLIFPHRPAQKRF